MIVRAYLRLVRRWRWSLLLAILIGTILAQPLWPPGPFGKLATFTLATLIFGGAIYAGRHSPRVARGVVALLVLGFLLEMLSFFGVPGLERVLAGVALVIVVAAMVATFTELIGSHDSSPDGLIGAIFGYFLIAVAWSLLYWRLETLHPGSFRFAAGGGHDIQLLYFSLITITTVGYGDILPVTPIARVWAALEAAAGTLYIAILIGRIVGELRFGRAGLPGRRLRGEGRRPPDT